MSSNNGWNNKVRSRRICVSSALETLDEGKLFAYVQGLNQHLKMERFRSFLKNVVYYGQNQVN